MSSSRFNVISAAVQLICPKLDVQEDRSRQPTQTADGK